MSSFRKSQSARENGPKSHGHYRDGAWRLAGSEAHSLRLADHTYPGNPILRTVS